MSLERGAHSKRNTCRIKRTNTDNFHLKTIVIVSDFTFFFKKLHFHIAISPTYISSKQCSTAKFSNPSNGRPDRPLLGEKSQSQYRNHHHYHHHHHHSILQHSAVLKRRPLIRAISERVRHVDSNARNGG